MHFPSTLAALSVLFATINAATIAAHPAQQTHATQIKHLAYKCGKTTNAQTCARDKATLYQKELRGCDVSRTYNNAWNGLEWMD
jgi:hypothetical protein